MLDHILETLPPYFRRIDFVDEVCAADSLLIASLICFDALTAPVTKALGEIVTDHADVVGRTPLTVANLPNSGFPSRDTLRWR